MSNLSSRNKTLVRASRNFTLIDIKISWIYPILLDLFVLPQLRCLGLSLQTNFYINLVPVSFKLQCLDIFSNFKAFFKPSLCM